MFLSAIFCFFNAAITACMRAVSADSAAAALAAWTVTPADSVTLSGTALASPWPAMVRVRGAGSAKAGPARTVRAANVAMRLSFMGKPRCFRHADGAARQNRGSRLMILPRLLYPAAEGL